MHGRSEKPMTSRGRFVLKPAYLRHHLRLVRLRCHPPCNMRDEHAMQSNMTRPRSIIARGREQTPRSTRTRCVEVTCWSGHVRRRHSAPEDLPPPLASISIAHPRRWRPGVGWEQALHLMVSPRGNACRATEATRLSGRLTSKTVTSCPALQTQAFPVMASDRGRAA